MADTHDDDYDPYLETFTAINEQDKQKKSNANNNESIKPPAISILPQVTVKSNEKQIEKFENHEIEMLAEQFKEYFIELLNGRQIGKSPEGFLTVFNHIISRDQDTKSNGGQSEHKNHWIVVPFEFGFDKEQRHIKGDGVFRVFLDLLKNFTVNISSLGSISEAIITSGGISTKEIKPKTMESKLISNLFFCGEVIDVDAYTGGFNLQIAFSTGRLAGENI